jgi:leucyl/phenylalanyl-tRNA---protein transferase
MLPDGRLTPDILLRGYAAGIFPMAERRDDPTIHWVDPRRRGILLLDGFHISRSLSRRIRAGQYEVRADQSFDAVVEACADRSETWINADIQRLYGDLHRAGHAHCIEIWQDGELAGGVYGVTLGAAFFGESMFSRRTDASKLALAHAVHRLRAGGFQLFDTQFLTPHLASLGALEITRAEYRQRLETALLAEATFFPEGYSTASGSALSSAGASAPGTTQRSTQTS